ncbi:MAG: LamG domain-containing protein, partial [Candidatus Pacebacteria bacterium]|nr:LamG domain-containing protein [Candidatus Paceibacterota bacterium]
MKKETNKNKKINLILSFLFSCICFFSFIDIASAAGPYDLSGYAWSENIGWINFGESNIIGKNLSFDGTGDFVAVSHSSSLTNLRVFTFSFWMYVDSFTGDWVSLFSKMDSSGSVASRTFASFLNINGSVYACSSDAEGQQCATTAAGTIETGKWYHYSAVIDRNSGVINLYINGELSATNTVRTTDAISNESPIYIGSHGTSYSILDGYFDNVSFWNVARNQTQIQNNMWTELNGNETGLVGYWDFNEESGSVANDKTSNNNDGVVTGATWNDIGYGVSIGSDNIFTGYAWSENIGWISFNPADLTGCPSGTCNAQLVGDKIVGWARQLNLADGWIKLGPNIIESIDYGAYLSNNDILGYAWSDNFGWLSFSCENQGSCGTVQYGVSIEGNVSTSNYVTNINYCNHLSTPTVNTGLTVSFAWDYTGDSSQKSYTIQVSTNSSFTSPFEVTANTASTSYILNLEGSGWNGEQLNWGSVYYWRVMVESEAGDISNWSSAQTINISRTHASPLVVFSNSRQIILEGRIITFIPQSGEIISQTYDASTPSYLWTFTGGDPETSTESS